MVTDAQKSLVKSTWGSCCKGDLAGTGNLFYVKLQESAPDVFAVFPFAGEDAKSSPRVASQALKTMEFLDKAVGGIDNLDGVKGLIAPLAQRHTNYGAKKMHFPAAGDCLVAALQAKCGGSWTPAATDAWKAFYAFIQEHLTAHLS